MEDFIMNVYFTITMDDKKYKKEIEVSANKLIEYKLLHHSSSLDIIKNFIHKIIWLESPEFPKVNEIESDIRKNLKVSFCHKKISNDGNTLYIVLPKEGETLTKENANFAWM